MNSGYKIFLCRVIVFSYLYLGGHNDGPAIETKLAPYGSSIEMDCHVDLEPPVKFQWNKLGGLLSLDTETYQVQRKYSGVTLIGFMNIYFSFRHS